MKTYEISKTDLNGAEPICYGYKVIMWDNGTRQDFTYGKPDESLVGRVFRVVKDAAGNAGIYPVATGI